jgi:hypothetical protein
VVVGRCDNAEEVPSSAVPAGKGQHAWTNSMDKQSFSRHTGSLQPNAAIVWRCKPSQPAPRHARSPGGMPWGCWARSSSCCRQGGPHLEPVADHHAHTGVQGRGSVA